MEFALPDIHIALKEPGDGLFRDTAWLQASYRAPEAFAAALLSYPTELEEGPIKSGLESGYDFYHDLVLRHAADDRPAFLGLGLDHRWQSLSYRTLHALCTQRRGEWTRRGVLAGQRLCVLAELGVELLVSLFTGLRMGLELSLLPPAGADFLAGRLSGLAPKWVATARRYRPLLSAELWQLALVAEAGSSPLDPAVGDSTSHTYSPDAIALRLFSLTHEPVEEPVEVTAADAYLGALRDGLLLLGLKAGEVVAVAARPLLQVQPALLFTVMLRRATLLQLTDSDLTQLVQAGDSVARFPPVQVLFANAALRRAALQLRPGALFGGLKLWISSPQEASEDSQWRAWIAHCGLERAAAIALLYDAACGGSVLFSLRRLGMPPAYLMPTPGRPFELRQPDGTEGSADPGPGIYQPTPRAVKLIIGRVDGGYIYAGTAQPTRDGRVYPRAELEKTVGSLPFVRGTVVVEQPSDRGRFSLLVFTGPETQAYAQAYLRQREMIVRQSVIQRLTPDHLPTQIVLSSVLPRLLNDGTIDRAWCTQQFLCGALGQRAENPIFALLDRLVLALRPT